MRKLFLLAICGMLLTGCASTPDPAKVCTSDWISKRAGKAVADITGDTQGAVKSIRKVAGSYVEGKTPGPLQMFALSRSLKSLEKELTRGSGIRDLKTVAKTCNNPKIMTDGLTAFVDDMGLPPQMVRIVESLPQYRNIIESHLRDIAPRAIK